MVSVVQRNRAVRVSSLYPTCSQWPVWSKGKWKLQLSKRSQVPSTASPLRAI